MIYVFNKIDASNKEDLHVTPDRDYFMISAKTGEGISELLRSVRAAP